MTVGDTREGAAKKSSHSRKKRLCTGARSERVPTAPRAQVCSIPAWQRDAPSDALLTVLTNTRRRTQPARGQGSPPQARGCERAGSTGFAKRAKTC